MRNIIWQIRERIRRGEREPLRELIRTFWYMYVKPTLSRAGALAEETDQYKQLSGQLVNLVVDQDLMRYSEIGFRDGRKGSLWDSRWEVLRDDFAQNNGIVSLDTQNTRWDVKMAVYEINKRLRKIFNRNERYIYYDVKTGTYKTKFKMPF